MQAESVSRQSVRENLQRFQSQDLHKAVMSKEDARLQPIGTTLVGNEGGCLNVDMTKSSVTRQTDQTTFAKISVVEGDWR